jgi:hypothetical protein
MISQQHGQLNAAEARQFLKSPFNPTLELGESFSLSLVKSFSLSLVESSSLSLVKSSSHSLVESSSHSLAENSRIASSLSQASFFLPCEVALFQWPNSAGLS